jgi:hypothetical protein
MRVDSKSCLSNLSPLRVVVVEAIIVRIGLSELTKKRTKVARTEGLFYS